ncbi:glycoside hydrolase family 76 protein [Streptomyces profundus]|uniref:glycoside hydrolase family 76 protein n=1 Tax=Streptomyces profundus TaxID=2867410 RepID=UPI001D16551E|nr:glycoside hydrolase family 76 protein [Streptomyces sp. MA3_2.13]UED83316.1 glycoside hydrolase family 76 protein [Streptomyces sp. MA3_2.13]
MREPNLRVRRTLRVPAVLLGTALLATSLAATATSAQEPSVPAEPAPAPAATVCNEHCDGRDTAEAAEDRLAVSAELHGRTVELRFDDSSAMGWAAVSDSSPGDQVWLDRSFDGGASWADDSRIGDTTTPDGADAAVSPMFNVDHWGERGVGALRACLQATGQPEITCTDWARSTWNAGEPATAAATALMMLYDPDNGLFENHWWVSANAVTAIIDNIRVTGMPSYAYVVETTYEEQIDGAEGQFRNEYLDDTGWWALAWIGAYDLTGEERYLETARAGADHMDDHWTDLCGGGVQWMVDNPYKNAVTNELYIQLNAALHNRLPGDTVHLERAERGWAWLANSGMINEDNLVNDGLDAGNGCVNNGQTTWTYNQGVILGALAELSAATGDEGLLETARTLADASTTAPGLHQDGVLTEPCEPDCGADGPSFKGPYTRGLGALDEALPDRPYTDYLQSQANAAMADARTSLDMYDLSWRGLADSFGVGQQHAALDLLNAAR